MTSLYPLSPNKKLIRLGPKGDGGYLLPDDLEEIHACFSPGVSIISGFEMDCAERGMKVFLADKSVDGPAEEHELFHFTKTFVGAISNEEFMTLDEWVCASVPEKDSDLLLQIDIEGHEYEVFLSTSNSLMTRFRIIVAEFHYLDLLWSDPFFNLASRAFEKILQNHSCVHIHPNNFHGTIRKAGITIPKTMEFTFLRNDRISRKSYQTIFPNPLDCDNTGNATLSLPNCWYLGAEL
ncbi:FkbM family methyltransferase [Cyanobium sp. Copco_Reservoir_LC18]|uniref:FkbM family methyltransferase n=1 Tax=Cyanobium sp. Copco_Reservoir_LC18 TaxID=1328305 RepID=UPI00191578AF|nr:FkbM family methyltransferase [Cyanobium sp. Copco_Reservoir_LC18]